MMEVIDAENMILGRLATRVAKELILGKKIVIVNAEKSVVTGKKDVIFPRYKEKFDRGNRYKGPFFPKEPHMIVKRTIRGMLPFQRPKGKNAFKNLIVHIGVPDEFKDKQLKRIEKASIEKSNSTRFVFVEDISKFLGWKPKI